MGARLTNAGKITIMIAALVFVSVFRHHSNHPNDIRELYNGAANALHALDTATVVNNERHDREHEGHEQELQAIDEIIKGKQRAAAKVLEDTMAELDRKRGELAEIDAKIGAGKVALIKAAADASSANALVKGIKRDLGSLKRKESAAVKRVQAYKKSEMQMLEKVSEAEQKKLADQSFKDFAFNEYESSRLPIDRDIPDTRVPECKALEYDLSRLPQTSVIICFVNEAWSALLRSIWSVLNRTPHELIHEIILIDDGSTAEWLGGVGVPRLREYIETDLPAQISFKVVTSPTRLGLIRARLLGAKTATGEVLTFLDSHIECNLNWLEPILEPIGKDYRTVVTPVIDTIMAKTMEHASWVQRVPAVGTFGWTMDFGWKGGVIKPGDKVTDPVDSPTMAGGLFSISKKYFNEIGTYDEEMDGWGGENIEISFRIWQCGGLLVTAPCSHVGHIFRDTHPYTVPGASIHETFLRNSKRLAEVWMDDYKEYFYNTRPQVRKMGFGNITKRLNLRKELGCKPFKWYMETILPDMFIPDAEHIQKFGALRNPDGQCLDMMGSKAGGKAGVYFCHGQGSNQAFMYTSGQELRVTDDLCIDAWATSFPGDVFLQKCHGGRGNQEWFHKPDGSIVHSTSDNCLESMMVGSAKELKINKCSGGASQKWSWDIISPDQSL